MIPDGIILVPCDCGTSFALGVAVSEDLVISGETVETHQCQGEPERAATIRP